jgi:hypothetical protein
VVRTVAKAGDRQLGNVPDTPLKPVELRDDRRCDGETQVEDLRPNWLVGPAA